MSFKAIVVSPEKQIEIEIPFSSIIPELVSNAYLGGITCHDYTSDHQVVLSYQIKVNDGHWELRKHILSWEMVKMLYGKERETKSSNKVQREIYHQSERD